MTARANIKLHPYDGLERRFRHTDKDRRAGLEIIAQLLLLPIDSLGEGTLYDLSFYSGGIGTLDRLAITLPASSRLWVKVVAALGLQTPEEAMNDSDWFEDFIWLLAGDESIASLSDAAVAFVNRERLEFQAPCSPSDLIYFAPHSTVNSWLALWGDEAMLHYRCYEQG